MIRKIIHIDEEKCNGCGLCADACHEGAIEVIGGKAKLTRDDHCDGLGDCLPSCPTGAITFEEREAAAYDEEAVRAHRQEQSQTADPGFSGCPGTRARALGRDAPPRADVPVREAKRQSALMQWPTQIRLMPVRAPYYDGAKLLVAADCSAFACASLHEDLMRGHVTVIGCPKLDDVDHSEKLTQIIAGNDIREVTIVRMEVPCCGGLENAAKKAIQASGKFLPWRVVVLSVDGKVLD